ncbi:hypothetical protein [Paenibacillus durus]|uniref:Uncharacterized protein n=1 Tax=Paenibacillus durus TaxID=44251 RepID=A0A089HRA8_PAEDU|nr:hypothetical protein [Paenibacillus durus]AIQ14541.1 hypothetical protein PDUR_23610 [Paenibacillus durus]
MCETHSKILIFFKNEHLHLPNISNWLRTAPEFDAYKFHSITSTKHDGLSFKEELFTKCVEKDMLQKPPIYITIFDKKGHEILINKGRQITCLSISLHSLTTQRTFEDWLKFTDGFFESKIGIAACVYPKDDFFWQRNTDLGQYKKYGKSTEGLQTIQKNKSTTIINPKTLPGFPMYVDEIWFGSTWMMWFGPEYYKYIPRERLLQFKQAFQTMVFDNGSIFIQLYESVEDVEKEESRQVQCRTFTSK